MGNLLRRIKYVAGNIFTDTYLSRDQKTLITILTLLFFGNGFSGAFVNAFLFSNGGGLRSVLIYNLFTYGGVVVFSLLVALVARRFTMKNSLIVGMSFYITMYAIILIFQQSIGGYAWLVGLFTALANSFFYIPHSCLVFQMTDNGGRDYYFARQGIFTTAGNLIAPFASGYVIQLIGGINGYLTMFAMSLIMYSIAGVMAFRLSKAKMINKKSYLFLTLRLAMIRPNFRNVTIAGVLRGLREGTMWVLAGTLLMKVTANTSVVGMYSLITSLMLIISLWVSQKLIREHNRARFLFLGVSGLVVPSLLFLMGIDVYIMFAYGIISSMLMAFFNTPVSCIYYNVLSTLPSSNRRSLEGMAIQESMLNIGRFISIFVLFFVYSGQRHMIYVMVGSGVIQLATWFFYMRGDKWSRSMLKKAN